MTIQKANKIHLEEIREITNYSILNSNYNFNFEPKTIKDIEDWYNEHEEKNLPIIVCLDNNNVLGWASLSTFRSFQAYNTTSEVSVYVKEEYKQKGIGKKLMLAIEKEGKKCNLHSIVSVITGGNQASINLHKKMGYNIKGTFEEIGYKNDQFLDVIFMYKIIN